MCRRCHAALRALYAAPTKQQQKRRKKRKTGSRVVILLKRSHLLMKKRMLFSDFFDLHNFIILGLLHSCTIKYICITRHVSILRQFSRCVPLCHMRRHRIRKRIYRRRVVYAVQTPPFAILPQAPHMSSWRSGAWTSRAAHPHDLAFALRQNFWSV